MIVRVPTSKPASEASSAFSLDITACLSALTRLISEITPR